MQNTLQNNIINGVSRALAEDIGSGDLTASLIDESTQANAKIIARQPAIICGLAWAKEVFNQIDPSLKQIWQVKDGDKISKDQLLCTISGSARSILTAERTALNFLQTLSATATTTAQYVHAIEGTNCRILDTRKTIPGLRLAQKYAVTVGGGLNHRIGLYDGILIKENHIYSSNSIAQAVSKAQTSYSNKLLIEVEVETLDELKQAIEIKAQRIMLDNFNITALQAAVKLNNSRAELEASGDITLENITQIAKTGVDFISLGALTKNIQAIDLSLLFKLNNES